MKIINCRHVTATEKKHLKVFFDSGMTEAKVNTKYYSVISGMLQGDKFLYKIRIRTPRKNDYNERIFETQTIEVLK